MRVGVMCERSGVVRDAFIAAGHEAMSCDLEPSDTPGPHYQGDCMDVLDHIRLTGGGGFDLLIYHPPCTFFTVASVWALKDPDMVRYPDKGGYHQRVQAHTLTGAARRKAQAEALKLVEAMWLAPVKGKALENPVGQLSTLWRKPTQTIQPWWFGDDASKATCLWLEGVPKLVATDPYPPRIVEHNGKLVKRWGNQTDSRQNRLTPSDDRAKQRSVTYAGVAKAMADQWGNYLHRKVA